MRLACDKSAWSHFIRVEVKFPHGYLICGTIFFTFKIDSLQRHVIISTKLYQVQISFSNPPLENGVLCVNWQRPTLGMNAHHPRTSSRLGSVPRGLDDDWEMDKLYQTAHLCIGLDMHLHACVCLGHIFPTWLERIPLVTFTADMSLASEILRRDSYLTKLRWIWHYSIC